MPATYRIARVEELIEALKEPDLSKCIEAIQRNARELSISEYSEERTHSLAEGSDKLPANVI